MGRIGNYRAPSGAPEEGVSVLYSLEHGQPAHLVDGRQLMNTGPRNGNKQRV